MALLESNMIPIGTTMPSFSLPDPFGKTMTTKTLVDTNGILVIFTCNHCPYAIAVWSRLIDLSKVAKEHKIQTVAINPNIHPNYPEDSPEKMVEKITEWDIPFPYLIDEDQSIAKAYQAECTPDIYLMDKSNKLVYHGRIDDNWKDEQEVKQQDLKNAIINLATNKSILSPQYPSMGCSIKWKN